MDACARYGNQVPHDCRCSYFPPGHYAPFAVSTTESSWECLINGFAKTCRRGPSRMWMAWVTRGEPGPLPGQHTMVEVMLVLALYRRTVYDYLRGKGASFRGQPPNQLGSPHVELCPGSSTPDQALQRQSLCVPFLGLTTMSNVWCRLLVKSYQMQSS